MRIKVTVSTLLIHVVIHAMVSKAQTMEGENNKIALHPGVKKA